MLTREGPALDFYGGLIERLMKPCDWRHDNTSHIARLDALVDKALRVTRPQGGAPVFDIDIFPGSDRL